MIDVTPTQDLEFIAKVMSTPGMKELSSGGLPVPEDIHAVISDPRISYFKVIKDGSEAGFVSFHKSRDEAAAIHVALKTRGKDTLEAISKSINQIRDEGVKIIYAIYPTDRLSLDGLCDTLKFSKLPDYNHSGLTFSVRCLTPQ